MKKVTIQVFTESGSYGHEVMAEVEAHVPEGFLADDHFGPLALAAATKAAIVLGAGVAAYLSDRRDDKDTEPESAHIGPFHLSYREGCPACEAERESKGHDTADLADATAADDLP